MNKKDLRIVLVEDDFIINMYLENILKRDSYEIVGVFDSGEELINKFDELNPNLLVIDIGLAGKMDGIKTASIIKEKYNIPIIFLTGNSDIIKNNEEIKAINPLASLIKPLDEFMIRNKFEELFSQ